MTPSPDMLPSTPPDTQPDTLPVGLADGLAERMERWAAALGDDAATRAAVRHVARALSLAAGDGHVCQPLAALTADPGATDRLRDRLRASALVGDPAHPGGRPLVLDAGDRLYLHRAFEHEQALARRLAQAAAGPPLAVSAAAVTLLRRLFPPPADGPADGQAVAVALALRQRLVVISGGPGTGKTTTVVQLLGCLLAQDPGCRIALAAPTGKAAARLSAALRERAGTLPPALRARLPAEASTVHRLLGVRGGPQRFAHHAGEPLAIDALVVDEASMLDLALARRLLDAVPSTARIVLLGDKDQLAAVEAGAVFAELSADPRLDPTLRTELAALCGAPVADPAPEASPAASAATNTAVWLTRNHRFAADTGIGPLAGAIRRGLVAPARAALREGGALQWTVDDGAALGAEALATLRAAHDAYLDTVRQAPGDVAAAAAAFARHGVLCAVREGPRGVATINRLLTQHALAQLGAGDTPWFIGRPVMVLRNDPLLRLFNGDVGLVLPDATGQPMVHFPLADGGWRAVPPGRLPPHETAFVMTVHKAQGSEFDAVTLLLPLAGSRVLSREMLYTAVTRARSQVSIIGSAEALGAAVATSTPRASGLAARWRALVDAGSAADPG